MTIIDILIDKEYLNEDEQLQLIMYILTFNLNKYQLQNIIETIDDILDIKSKLTVELNENLTTKLNNFIDFLNTCKNQCNEFITIIDEQINEHLEHYKVNPDDPQEIKLIKEFYKDIYLLINELDDKNENIINELKHNYGEYFIFIVKTIKTILDNINNFNNIIQTYKDLGDSIIYVESIKNNTAKYCLKLTLYKLKNNEEINIDFINIFNDFYNLIFDK